MGHESGQDCVTVFNIIQNYGDKHFQHFNTTQRYFSVWKVFKLETERFLPISGDKSRKWLELTGLAADKSLSNFVRSCSDVESQERSALHKCFWGNEYTWNWLSHYYDDATISQKNENRHSLLASSPFKGYREKSLASGTRKEMREQGTGKECESS